MEQYVPRQQGLDRSVRGRLRQRLRTQYGVISRDQACREGATDGQIERLLRSGEWETVFRTVYRHTAAPRCAEQAVLAACLAAGPLAVASHESAAWLWRLIDQPASVPTVTLPARRRSTIPGIRFHRSTDLDVPRVVQHRRIPCTDPLRTLVDLATRADPVALDDAVDRALARRLVTVGGLTSEIGRLGRRGRSGVPMLRASLRRRGFVGAPSPSVLESRTARAFLAQGVQLPPAEVTAGPDGEYRLDFAVAEGNVALEVDGYAWHSSPEHKQRDEARRRQLVLDGWSHLVYTWEDVTRQPDRMVREYLVALAGRAPSTAEVPTTSSGR